MIYAPRINSISDTTIIFALLGFAETLVNKPLCDNCGCKADPKALRTRHGLTGSYSTCPDCDIELEND